jgi:amidohydrolase
VDGAYGAHIWSEIPAGKISVEAGPRMANTDWWRIDVTGKSAHGALPHRGADAILAGAAIVEELQTIVSRSVSPFEPAVVTVGQFHGGTAKNVIAGTAWLEGTVRTFDAETHARMPHLMQRVARDTARALGCDANVTQYDLGSWAVVNDEHASALAARAVEEVLGPEWIGRYRGSMPGEDFSEYLFKVPGVFAFIGCANPDKGKAWPQHSAFYSPDEDVLVAGSLLAAQYAYDFLAE